MFGIEFDMTFFCWNLRSTFYTLHDEWMRGNKLIGYIFIVIIIIIAIIIIITVLWMNQSINQSVPFNTYAN